MTPSLPKSQINAYLLPPRVSILDRVPKKSKFAEWPAEFSVYSRDKYKNFLLKKFFKI